MKANTETWMMFDMNNWIQNGRVEQRDLGTVKWWISSHGNVKREYYDHDGTLIKSIDVRQHWKGRTKKYLAIPTGAYVHRLVAMHFIPNLNNDKIVLFIDGDVNNVTVDNLKWSDGVGIKTGIKLGPWKKNR